MLSAKRSARSHTSSHGNQMKGAVSYEDMLVAKYLDELRVSPTSPGNNHPNVINTQLRSGTQQTHVTTLSPYGQTTSQTHIVPTPTMNRRTRPQSAKTTNKPRVDAKFIADPNLWDPNTPRSNVSGGRRRQRPVSAPVYKRRAMRPLSATYGASRPTSAKLGPRKVRSMYKRQPHVIVVIAYKNGSRDTFAHIAAPNIKMLLEVSTERLGMPNAARRIFLEDGSEVFTPAELQRDMEVYISMGEQFKDPYKGTKQQTRMVKTSCWTMNGVQWAQENKKKKNKSVLSKRFRNMIEQSKRRVLIFRNGKGTEGVEIVADPERFEDFLVACTAKLDLGSYCRCLYDWEGKEITNLTDAPELDQCLQTWSTPVLGPLWVSKGEGFSPKGVDQFLTGLISYTKAKLKEAKHYQRQLQFAQETETKDQVEIVAILSMSETEIDEALEIVAKDIEDFTNALNRLKEQKKKIEEMVGEETSEGCGYTMKHIEKVEADSRLVGTKGVRLKVFENGTYENETVVYFNLQMASRGTGNDTDLMMARLLDQCSCSCFPKQNPSIRPMAQKIYNNMGKEIKSVYDLEYDQEMWLSFGEPWKNPFSFVLTAVFDKVKAIDINTSDTSRVSMIREQLMSEDVGGKDKSSCWEVVEGLPEDYVREEITDNSDPTTKDILLGQIATSEISSQMSFMRCKEEPQLLLYPEVNMDTKKSKGSKEMWPAEAQSMVISKGGYIYNKAIPSLVLCITSQKISTQLIHPTLGKPSSKVQGLVVGFQKKMMGSAAQVWRFTADGNMYSEAEPELFLTYLGSRYGDEESQATNQEEEGSFSGQRFTLAVCEKIDGKDAKSQRFALKQERMDNLGQWKHTKAENPEWNKKALSWPVKEDGQINQDYDWPMEGFFLPYAPPLNKTEKTTTGTAAPPMRLLVMRNGVRDVSKSLAVVGPDLTNMKKDMHNRSNKKQKGQQQKAGSGEEVLETDEVLHCDEDLTVLKLEFILFLERCTNMLDLPFAARRLFDANGREHFSLRDVTRDQMVYASCGEPWSDPSISKAEQQRRYLLSNLASDLQQIRQFVSMRSPNDLVLEVESLQAGSHVRVARSVLTEQEEEDNKDVQLVKTVQTSEENTDNKNLFETGNLTAHEQAHQRAEERLDKLKWPWERAGHKIDAEEEDEEEKKYSNKELYHKYKSKSKKREDDIATLQQKFIIEDGYICCSSNQNLVLGVQEAEGHSSEVILEKRKPDDIHQRWILQENGIIQSKHNPQMVLTVSMPTSTPAGSDQSAVTTYAGSPVLLQKRKSAQFGRANQRWQLNSETGNIEAFHTDNMDKEITAANRANVCTYSVLGGLEIDQPGYTVDMTTDKGTKTKKFIVCSSCARAMRGRYKLEKVHYTVDFACNMGNAKSLGVRQIGSFQCLNGKVDLSEHEAAHTLTEWEGQLDKLREELSVRTIAREISAAKVPYTAKVLVYRNSDGRLKPGELIVGSSVPGILEQATERLRLTQAARRLYTADGLIVLDLDDLIEWVKEQYVKEAHKQMRAEARARKAANKTGDASTEKEDMMAKVDLDSSDDEEDEEDETVVPAAPQQPESDTASVEEKTIEFSVGYEETSTRANMDPWKNCVVIPNPAEEIEQDGVLVSWKLFAKAEGPISLQIYRPSSDDLTAFMLVGQTTFTIPAPGAYAVDIADKAPIEVKAGDMVGIYTPESPIIPFDVDDDVNQSPFYMVMTSTPEVNQTYKMDTRGQSGTRKYSLNATIVSVVKSEPKQPIIPPAPPGEQEKKKKTGKKGKKSLPHVDPPPLEMILRYPIEVWASCGEQFVKPGKVEKSYEEGQQHREERAAVAYELEKEKHVLRQMQGRRYDEQSPGNYRSTQNPQHPVLIQGHWQEPTVDELQKHDVVHQLQTHLQEMKTVQKQKKLKTCVVKDNSRLYTQPDMKRVLVYPNGEYLERAVYAWGESMAQILDNANVRLNLRKEGRCLFNIEGHLVSDFDEIERDQLLCVSHNKNFLQPKESKVMIEVKANWGRARKKYGPAATDLVVHADRNPQVDVDAFGPSAIAGGQS